MLLYDWFSATFRGEFTLDDVFVILGLEDLKNKFEPCNGVNGYQNRLSYNGINLHYRGRAGMGIWLEMSGKGCRAWEEYGKGDWLELFNFCWTHPTEINVTRVDIAYDDITCSGGEADAHCSRLSMDRIVKAVRNQHYISKFKDWEIVESSKGTTVNLGSKSSRVLFRIYDKAKEQGVDGHWVRFEVQLRDERALNFVHCNYDRSRAFFGVVNQYLRFVDPTGDSHRNRWPTSSWWEFFLADLRKLQLWVKPGLEYSVQDLEHYVFVQAGRSIRTAMSVIGMEAVIGRICGIRLEDLNPKQKLLLSTADANVLQYGRRSK